MSKKRNIVFLDIDGVLINRESLSKSSGSKAQANPDCVAALNRITEAAQASIVLSSAWRIGQTLPAMQRQLSKWGVKAPLIDFTPDMPNCWRGTEILSWLAVNERLCLDFVILDDDYHMWPFMSKLVRTKTEIGLTNDHVHPALEKLQMGNN